MVHCPWGKDRDSRPTRSENGKRTAAAADTPRHSNRHSNTPTSTLLAELLAVWLTDHKPLLDGLFSPHASLPLVGVEEVSFLLTSLFPRRRHRAGDLRVIDGQTTKTQLPHHLSLILSHCCLP